MTKKGVNGLMNTILQKDKTAHLNDDYVLYPCTEISPTVIQQYGCPDSSIFPIQKPMKDILIMEWKNNFVNDYQKLQEFLVKISKYSLLNIDEMKKVYETYCEKRILYCRRSTLLHTL